jgi:opacity protein-like surface antigen
MKKILLVIALAGMLIPTIASAELNYNSVGIDYSKTSQSGDADLSGIDIGISKSVYSNVFLTGSIFNGRQSSGTAQGDLSVYEFSEGVGYHAPIQYNIDFIVSGTLQQNRSKLAGTSANENGYALGVGIRAELSPKFEGEVSGDYFSMSSNSFTSTGTGIDVTLGFMVTPEFKLLADIGSKSNKPPFGLSYNTRTIDFGARFYF